ncbi:Spo0B domain-containing protein [Alkalihalobacillus pseudalcaliphilus]|uniref:Spo0B domain-containing protein n=1 Tax=Alkalihalobacillus pseudalcaliphilus TaxID=79884 RepID=UPI00069E841F|nr:Spo0B domain-containing protein [Alkalihalobacillus pseudalcaliphilus]
MTKEINVIEALRHNRHDWLNVMQLVKTNLALGNYERIEELIQQTVQTCVNESKLSSLGIPKVATKLLTYNWLYGKESSLHVEVNVAGNEANLNKREDLIDGLVTELLSSFSKYSDWRTENHLLITFVLNESCCELLFQYEGDLQVSSENLFVFDHGNEFKIEIVEWQRDTCLLRVQLPINRGE